MSPKRQKDGKSTPETGRAKQLYITVGYYPTRKDALNALAEFNNNPYDINVAKVTFEDIYERWSDEHFPTVSDSNVTGYKAAWALCDKIAKMRFVDVKLDHLQMIVDESGKNYPPLRKLKVLLCMMYKYAMIHEILLSTSEGEHFKYRNYYDSYWMPLIETLNMTHRPHDTRHTCISMLTDIPSPGAACLILSFSPIGNVKLIRSSCSFACWFLYSVRFTDTASFPVFDIISLSCTRHRENIFSFVSYVLVTVKILCVFVVSHRNSEYKEIPESSMLSGILKFL